MRLLKHRRHGHARDVFHGKRGELFQRYREGQEDQSSALGLVVNMARLSSFSHKHINIPIESSTHHRNAHRQGGQE